MLVNPQKMLLFLILCFKITIIIPIDCHGLHCSCCHILNSMQTSKQFFKILQCFKMVKWFTNICTEVEMWKIRANILLFYDE